MFRALVALPDPATDEWVDMRKRVVVLHNENQLPNCVDFAFVLYSTLKRDKPRSFEVLVDPAKHATLGAKEFDRPAIIDCRWVRTERKTRLERGEWLGRLPREIMDEVNKALTNGLGMVDE